MPPRGCRGRRPAQRGHGWPAWKRSPSATSATRRPSGFSATPSGTPTRPSATSRSGPGFSSLTRQRLPATEQARALATSGQLEQACALALAAYDIGYGYDSERVRQAVRDFRASLGSRAPHRVTAELDERLHSAYATRTN